MTKHHTGENRRQKYHEGDEFWTARKHFSTEKVPCRSSLDFNDVALHQASCRTQDLILKLKALHRFVTMDGNHVNRIMLDLAGKHVLRAMSCGFFQVSYQRILHGYQADAKLVSIKPFRTVSILPVQDESH